MPSSPSTSSSHPQSQSQSQPTHTTSNRTRSRSKSPDHYSPDQSTSVQNHSTESSTSSNWNPQELATTTTTSSSQILNPLLLDSDRQLNKRARTNSPAITESTQNTTPASPISTSSNSTPAPATQPITPSSASISTSTGSSWLKNTFVEASNPNSTPTNSNSALVESLSLNDPSSSSSFGLNLNRSLNQNSTSISPSQAFHQSNHSEMQIDPPQTSDSMTQEGQEASTSISIPSVTSPPPSPEEQLKIISKLKSKSLEIDEVWFVLPRSWYQLWATKCSSSSMGGKEEKVDEGFDASELEVGPINAEGLMAEAASGNGQEKPALEMGLGIGQDIEVVPKEAYQLLEAWYGAQGPTFPRSVISRNNDLRIELFPPRFNFVKVVSVSPAASALPPPITLSVMSTYQELMWAAKEAFGFWKKMPDKGFRLIRIPEAEVANPQAVEMLIPDETLNWEKVDGEKMDATLSDLQLDLPYQLLAFEASVGNSFNIMLESDPPKTKPIPMFARTSGQDSFSNLEANKVSAVGTGFNNVNYSSSSCSSNNYNTRSSAFGRGYLNNGTKGVTGLQNLGNTCFMNSALQCLSNTPQLQNYFLEEAYKKELNVDNPLGMGGVLATTFGMLLQKLWSGSGSSFPPREFKHALGKFAPQFLGYSQQDTQELLAFLLDGLHEDLNRIIKKPYTEAPDWTGGDLKDMVQFARKQWDLYKARNDSVIVDLFQGQYRSTLVCPTCSKVSIKFDPFMYLTLPIPNNSKKILKVFFLALDQSKPIQEITIALKSDAGVFKLKEKIGEIFGCESKRLVVADVFSHEAYSWLSDHDPISEIKSSDYIYLFEISEDFNNPRLNHKASLWSRDVEAIEEQLPELKSEDVAIVPVFSQLDGSEENGSQNYKRYHKTESFGIPFFVSIPLTKMGSVEEIEDIVLKGYERFTEKKEDLRTYAENRSACLLNETEVPQETQASLLVEPTGMPLESESVIDGAASGNGSGEKDASVTNSTSGSESWEMVDGQNTKVEQIQQLQQTADSLAEIGEGENSDAMLVETTDVQPVNSIQVISTETGDDSNSAQDQAPTSSNIPIFGMKFFVRNPNVILPTKGASSNAMEDLADRLKRGQLEAEAGALSASQEPAPMEETERSSTQEKGKMSEKEGEKTKSKKPFPLLYTGAGLVIQWAPAAKSYFFDGIPNDDSGTLWGPVAQATDPSISTEAQNSSRGRKSLSLDDCLNEFTKEEKLGEDDPWYCPQCKDFRQASKKFDLWKVPDILVVHLKRFSSGSRRNKLDDLIDFPIEGLDLTERVEGSKAYIDLGASGELPPPTTIKIDEKTSSIIDENDEAVASDAPIYDLYAVDNHYGGLGGGHYTAYAKNSKDKEWYSFDDSSTSKVGDVNGIKTGAAYLLFYCRRTSREIGGKTRDIIRSASAPQSAAGDEIMTSGGDQNGASASFLPAQVEEDEGFSPFAGHGGGYDNRSRTSSYVNTTPGRGLDENYDDAVDTPDLHRNDAWDSREFDDWTRSNNDNASYGSNTSAKAGSPASPPNDPFNNTQGFHFDDDSGFGTKDEYHGGHGESNPYYSDQLGLEPQEPPAPPPY